MRTPTQRFLFGLATIALILTMTLGFAGAATTTVSGDSTAKAAITDTNADQTTIATLTGTQIAANGQVISLTNATATITGTSFTLTGITIDSTILQAIAGHTGQNMTITLGAGKSVTTFPTYTLTNATATITGTSFTLTGITIDSTITRALTAAGIGQNMQIALGTATKDRIYITTNVSAISTGNNYGGADLDIGTIEIDAKASYTNNGATTGGGEASPRYKTSATKTTLTTKRIANTSAGGTATQ